MDRRLTDDPAYRATTFMVVDFETTTPKGRRPEPVEVAALALRDSGAGLAETGRFCELIRPPEHAPITPADTHENGLRPDDVADARPAAAVLADLDARLTSPPQLLIAHHAHVEAALLYDHREHCPRLAATSLIDTVRLARAVLPGLPSYSLDHLIDHLRLPRNGRRHRAMPDVEATAALFARLIRDGAAGGGCATLTDLRRASEVAARAAQPRQEAMF